MSHVQERPELLREPVPDEPEEVHPCAQHLEEQRVKRQLEVLRQHQPLVHPVLARPLPHDAQPQLQVELLRHPVPEELEEEEPRPRWHLLLQLSDTRPELRLEEATLKDRVEVLEPRVDVQRAEHVRHLQRLPSPVVHRRQERPRLPQLAKELQEPPPHLQARHEPELRQEKRRLLRLELELLLQPEHPEPVLEDPLELQE